jgi:PAS domain S-box-containing protein
MASWRKSLRGRLMLVALLSIAPALGFILHTGMETRNAAYSAAQDQVLSLVDDVSRQHRVMLEVTRRMLVTLAEDLPKTVDFSLCPRVFSALSAEHPFLFFANLGYADKQGKVVCSLTQAPETCQALPDRCLPQGQGERNVSIGCLQRGGRFGRGRVDFTYPVVDDGGRLNMVAFASLDISWFEDLARGLRLAEGATVTMIDSRGTVLSRNIRPEKWVGQAAPDVEIVKTVLSRGHGVTEARGIDGVQRIYGFSSLGQTPEAGYIYVGIPKAAVTREVWKDLCVHLAWLSVIAVLGVVALPSVAAPYFMRNVNVLLAAAGKIAAGDLTARTGLNASQGEMGQIGAAFDRMAEALQTRAAQQKQAEEHLQGAQDFVSAMVDSLPGSFYLLDHEGTPVRWGKQLEGVSGYSEHEIGSMNALDFIAEEDRGIVAQGIQDAISGQDVCIEVLIRTKDGQKIPHMLTARRATIMGSPCIVGVGMDVSKRKNAELALAESEQTLRTILDTVPTGIVLVEKRTIKWANQSWERMLGFGSPDEYVQQNSRILYPTDEEYDRAGREVSRDLYAGRIGEIDTTHLSRDGSTLDVNIRVKLVDPDDLTSDTAIAAISDISERKRAEGALRESERRFRELIENIELCSVILDVDGRIVFCNDFVLRLTGWSRAEVLEQDWFSRFFPQEQVSSLRKRYHEAVVHGATPLHTEVRILTRNGEERLTKWTTTLLRDASGRIVGSASVGEDITQQRQAEDAVRESKETLEAVFNAMTESIVLIDADTRILAANETAAARLGHSVDQLTGQLLYDFLPYELAQTRKAYLQEVLASGRQVRFRDRRAGWLFDNHMYPIKGAGGNPERVVVVGTDIAEKERVAEALSLERHKFQILCEHAPFGMVLIAADGTFLYINPRFKEIFGYRAQEIPAGEEWFALAYPTASYRQEAINAWKTDLSLGAVGKPRSRVFKVRCKDKTEKVARFIPVQLSSGEHLMTVEDITDQRQSEARLRESEERFRAIFESAVDCIFIKDRSGRYTQVNPAMERLFGLPAGQLLGLTDEALFGNETAAHNRDVESRVLKGHSVEEEHTKPVNGIPTTFSIVKVPLRDAAGKVAGLCGIARDITERREAGRRGSSRGKPEAAGRGQEYRSAVMRSILTQIRLAAATHSTVLLRGESGTGKDYLARMIHDRSPRAGGPYFVVNCATVSPQLAESELFGHESGAFTGATRRKLGLLELAEGGTLLLNEVGELPLLVQAKLLTFLDTAQFTRVGGEKQVTASARIIAATNRDLEHEMAHGRFRQDLFYRLNVIAIQIPPLRDRIDDLPLLVRVILTKLAESMQMPGPPEIGHGVMEAMSSYIWPGNVRELRNVLERALIISRGGTLTVRSLALEPRTNEWSFTVQFPANRSLSDVTADVRKSLLIEALRRTGGNKTRAAQLLGVSRFSVINYLKEFGITVEELHTS